MNFVEYDIIKEYYGNTVAKRSGVPYINHINEGLIILADIGASEIAMKAFCVHPIFQSDEALLDMENRAYYASIDPEVIMTAMEYRRVANNYLSKRHIVEISEIELSPLNDVNAMLIADKVQNYKDFLLYHAQTHSRKKELAYYFNMWLIRLGIYTPQLYNLFNLIDFPTNK